MGVLAELSGPARECVIVVHPDGHGNAEDLASLEADLHSQGFAVHKVALAGQYSQRSGTDQDRVN